MDMPSPEARLLDAGALVTRIPPRAGRHGSERGKPPRPPSLAEALLDPRSWTEPPPPRQWVVEDWIPKGVVTGCYGDGGVGKTLIAQLLCTCVSLGNPWLGLAVERGHAIGVFCEDSLDELKRRQWSINEHLGIEQSQLEAVRYLARLGHENSLITFDGSDIGTPTLFADQLHYLCEEEKPSLLVLDTIADLFPANENDRSKVRQFVQVVLGGIARRYGCAVLVLGHPSVTGISTGTGQSGSTAWNNTMRSRLYLTRPDGEDADPNDRILSRKKANYAARDAEVRLTWRRGVIDVAAGDFAKIDTATWEAIDAVFDEIDRAWKDGAAWSHKPQTRKDGRMIQAWAKQHLGIPEARLTALISDWLMNGFLAYETFDTKRKIQGLRVLKRLAREAA